MDGRSKDNCRQSMITASAAFLILSLLAATGMAASVQPLGNLGFHGPGNIIAIRASADGKRVIVILWRAPSSATLNVVDASDPRAPQVSGSLDVYAGPMNGIFMQAAISPDGQRALLSNREEAADKAVLTLVDLTDGHAPKIVWQQEVEALSTIVSLAGDASAYAAVTRTNGSANPFNVLIRRLSEGNQEIQYNGPDGGVPSLSDHAAFLTLYDPFELKLADLRKPDAVIAVQDIAGEFFRNHSDDDTAAGSFSSKYSCEIPRDDGIVLAPGFGTRDVTLLRPHGADLVPITTMPWPYADQSMLCRPLFLDSRDLIFWDSSGVIARLNVRVPQHPSIDGYWKTHGSYTSDVQASLLFGEGDEADAARVLQISRLEWADRSPVDWPRLNTIVSAAVSSPASGPTELRAATPDSTVIALEAAGIFNAIDVYSVEKLGGFRALFSAWGETKRLDRVAWYIVCRSKSCCF